jgi:RNA polymerase sigma-54 factor
MPMVMELKLSPKLQQQLVMTPQLKMAIKLLTLNHLELQGAISQELVENPVLDEVFEDPPERSDDREGQVDSLTPENTERGEQAQEVRLEKKDQTDNTSDIDWESYADSYSYLPPGASGMRAQGGDELPGYDQTLTRATTLEEHLLWQVRMSELNPVEMEIAVHLVGEMNDDGFLDNGPLHRPPVVTTGQTEDDADGTSKPAENSAQQSQDGNRADSEELLADGPSLEPELLADDAASDAAKDASRGNANGTGGHKSGADGELLQDEPELKFVDPIEMVAQTLEVPVSWVENVRQKVMTYDPVGCLSRDLRECLLAQLILWGYDDECLVFNVVDKHLGDVENRNFQELARIYQVPLAELGDAMKIVEQLEPRPSRNFLPGGTTEDQQYISPDAYVYKFDDEHVVSLNEDGLPKLKVSQFYLQQLNSAEKGDPSKTYIREKVRSATWLIRSIHQRQRTIYKVVDSILKYQKSWFDETGPLQPLVLKDVAEDIEMHESTVSRVTTRKYLHCNRGIFELKYFFNSSIATADGLSIASEAVKDEIGKLIAAENPKKPMSDSSLVKSLKEKNINIARRTVAKYREMLGILPSNKRKQIF